MSILIIGVTGVVGRHVARALRAEGRAVRGMTRDPARADDLARIGVDIVQGDLIDPASLARSLAGVDAVLATAHQSRGVAPHTSEAVDDRGHRSLVDLAAASRVKRFVYVSARGAAHDHPVDFFRTKAGVEDHLRASGVPFTVLRPSAFMEWHVHEMLGVDVLATGRPTVHGTGDNPINFVAAADVAAIAVECLTTDRYRDATVEIGGPDNLSKNAVARLYARHADVALSVTHVPIDPGASHAPSLDPVARRLASLRAWFDTADLAFDPVAGDDTRRIAPTTVDAFVRWQVERHRAAR